MSHSERTRALADERAKAWDAYKAAQDAYDKSPDGAIAATAATALAAVEEADRKCQAQMRADEIESRVEALDGGIRTTPVNVAVKGGEDYAKTFNAYLRGGMSALNSAQRQAMQTRFENAQATTPNSAGGFLVPDETLLRMVEVMRAYGGIMDLAETLTTSGGNPIDWPTSNDTANIGAILAENTQDTELDFAFGNVTMGAFTYTSKIVRVSEQLLQDSAFNLDSWLPRKLGERIGRALAAHLVAGNGTTQPQGLITAATTTQTTATTLVITFDDLIELMHRVDPAYRTAAARFLLSDGALKALRKTKDTTGQYLWQPGRSLGEASTIMGVPYVIDNNMTSVNAVGARMVAYGDFREGYVIRVARGVTTKRLTERYADFLQVGFLAFARYDAKIQNQSAIAVLVGL